MGELVFTQQCLSKLAQIRREMEKEFGYSYQLSSSNHLVDLLRAAAYAPDEEIQQCFRDFLQGLDKQQLKKIAELGISLPAEFAINA
jgi:hypothetical protein